MRYMNQAFRVALALTLTASPAAAQFTGVVAPPKPRQAASATAVAETTPGARSDSAGRTALADMRAWVDSAAGVAAPTTASTDSTRDTTWTSSAGAVDTASVPAGTPPAASAGDGMRAPDTATMLPAVAVAGLAMLAAGAWLLRRAART